MKNFIPKTVGGRGKMKKLVFLALMVGSVFARFEHEPTGWQYEQSTLQAFYMLEDITVDGEGVGSGDYVGAFLDGVCVGFYEADPGGYTTIPLMGDDGGVAMDGYCSMGDIPDLFIYDASNDAILSIASWCFNSSTV